MGQDTPRIDLLLGKTASNNVEVGTGRYWRRSSLVRH